MRTRKLLEVLGAPTVVVAAGWLICCAVLARAYAANQYAAPKPPTGDPDVVYWEAPPRAVSLRHYQQVQEGMHYENVFQIIGWDGKEVSRLNSTATFRWSNSDGSYMLITFQYWKVASKSHFALTEIMATGVTGVSEDKAANNPGLFPK
jgi:hypothetical protein